MCGIAGVYAPERHPSTENVGRMLAAMAHRGPDDTGTQSLANGALVFGHLRLSILDLSPLGHQPMSTLDQKIWITYNGEVYNFREIREELRSLGWTFRSDSDTEVILVAYRQWGLACVERFRGMFAFALWDDEEKSLHLCRDRFGVKPLYYSVRNSTLAFASESKALNVANHTDRTTNPIALTEFIQYGYISAPNSVFTDVRTVSPGTICSFDASLVPKIRSYWSANDLYDGDAAADLRRELKALPDDRLLDRVEDVLTQAFSYRLVADVPVGIFLSGGIDSSLVAALLARQSGRKLQTFTIGFGDSEFDETPFARAVADAVGSNHVEFTVSPQAALDATLEIPTIADEPIGDSSLVPTLLVSRLARQHVKVALSADGADELFGGYARYAYCGQFLGASRFVKSLYRLSGSVLEQLPPSLIRRAYAISQAGGHKFAAINDKLRKFVRMSGAHDEFEAYSSTASEWTSRDAARLLSIQPALHSRESLNSFEVRGASVFDRLMHFDLTRYLPGDLLTKVDRASMFVSLEAREPFLDHEMSKIAAALPLEWKIRGAKNKFILRRLLARHLPGELFERPKQGFTAPIGSWLRGPLRDVLMQELSQSRIAELGILDPRVAHEAALNFLKAETSGTSPAGVWFLLQLQQWAGRWLIQPTRDLVSNRSVHRATLEGVANSSA
jgi:asparagine synthase (glutamine-hydrolysing)